jgi:hypothetical protein
MLPPRTFGARLDPLIWPRRRSRGNTLKIAHIMAEVGGLEPIVSFGRIARFQHPIQLLRLRVFRDYLVHSLETKPCGRETLEPVRGQSLSADRS